MADGGLAESENTSPLPKFYFEVKWNSQVMLFQEVSGLDVESHLIEYRGSEKAEFSTAKMPGLTKVGNVTLKKGVFKEDARFWEWFDQIKMNTIKRATVTISLLDENSKPAMAWTLANAWPTKISGTDLKSEGNEVTVETIEIAHEGMTIANG